MLSGEFTHSVLEMMHQYGGQRYQKRHPLVFSEKGMRIRILFEHAPSNSWLEGEHDGIVDC